MSTKHILIKFKLLRRHWCHFWLNRSFIANMFTPTWNIYINALLCYILFWSLLASQFLSDPCFMHIITRFLPWCLCVAFHCTATYRFGSHSFLHSVTENILHVFLKIFDKKEVFQWNKFYWSIYLYSILYFQYVKYHWPIILNNYAIIINGDPFSEKNNGLSVSSSVWWWC